MKLKKLLSPILDPYVGPIFVITIILSFLVFIVIPKYSYENKIDNMTKKAVETLIYLQKIRTYYTNNVIEKLQYNDTVNVDYKYKKSYMTIPFPETMIHDLTQIISENGMKIKFYSKYPFENRKNRILNDFEKDSLSYLINNPKEIYKKDISIGKDRIFRVAIADVFVDSSCVNCHNNRLDSPKKDWKVGDVGGVIEVLMPFKDEILLTSKQINILLYIFSFLAILLGVHYTIISVKRTKEYERIKSQLEEEVKERTSSLNNTVKLLNEYKKAVDFSAIVSKTDKNGIITYANDQFEKISQLKKDELIGKSHNVVRHKDMPDDVYKELWKTIKAKKIWKGQIKNRAKDGTSYYVASTIVPILNYKDEIEEFLAIRLDITHIVEAQLEAQRADKAKSTFLANMSHEIRTPLNAIIGFSEILNKSTTLTKDEKKQASIIKTSANSLLSIINDILDVSKINSGNFEVKIESCDIYQVTKNVIDLFKSKSDEKNIDLRFNFDSKIPKCVKTDGVRIRQIVSNFVSNAIKFTPDKGIVSLNLTVIDKSEKNVLINFEIEDTGIGIPKEKLETIFDPFIQVDNKTNKKFEGTGLGLSICKYIIESLGSSVIVKSIENKGTKFSFTIDMKICNEENIKVEEENNSINVEVSNNEHFTGKILVAEDNRANQQLITYILEEMELEFKIVENGLQALEFIKETKYDLILMDINMPIMDGVEAFKKTREYEKQENKKTTPIIALTANAIKGDKERFLTLGMDGYLSKPINTTDLKNIFKQFLKQKTVVEKSIKKDEDISSSLIAQKLGISDSIAELILKKFKKDIINDIDELEKFIENEDINNIIEKAHYIKNSCLNVCLKNICDDLQILENGKFNKEENLKVFRKIKQQLLAII